MTRYLGRALLVLLCFSGLVLGVVLSVPFFAAPHIYSGEDTIPQTEAAMVLGASVKQSGELSPVLRQRADKALALYGAGKVQKILVTGDNADPSHNEVNPVGDYLFAGGIPKEDIFLDHAGFDTYSSMYRARDVFAAHSVTIVSQPFHLARAVFIARQLGLEAYGARTDEGGQFLYNTFREIPATLKAITDLVLAREPRYLGEQFPLTGDGSATWYGEEGE